MTLTNLQTAILLIGIASACALPNHIVRYILQGYYVPESVIENLSIIFAGLLLWLLFLHFRIIELKYELRAQDAYHKSVPTSSVTSSSHED